MFSYFENRKTTYFDVFYLNFSIKTKIQTLFLISYLNLSKKRNGTLGTRIDMNLMKSQERSQKMVKVIMITFKIS